MKKILLSLMMAVTAIGASAQNTYNVRVGGVWHGGLKDYTAASVMGQINIPFKNISPWVFSPAAQFAIGEHSSFTVMAHANVGFYAKISDGCLFVPKIGFAGGCIEAIEKYNPGEYENIYGRKTLFGPSVDLAFELKHFVVGLTGFYSINTLDRCDGWSEMECHVPMVSLALGYTF